MFCKNCGNEIKDGVKFCGKCGMKVQAKVADKVHGRIKSSSGNPPDLL